MPIKTLEKPKTNNLTDVQDPKPIEPAKTKAHRAPRKKRIKTLQEHPMVPYPPENPELTTPERDFDNDPHSIQNALSQTEECEPWHQMIGEEDKHYQWFHHWLTQGSHRSLLAAYAHFARQYHAKKSGDVPAFNYPNSVSQAWHRVKLLWDWDIRASAFDRHVRDKREAEFENRINGYRDKSLEYVDKLHERADAMLAYPTKRSKITKTVEGEIVQTPNGPLHQTIIQQITVEPAGWRVSDIPRMLKAADDLARTGLAIEVEAILKDLEKTEDEDQLLENAEASIKARKGEV